MADGIPTNGPIIASSPDWLERITGKIAVAGGILALAAAALVTVSVFLRWAFNAPIDGDFEFVKMATAITVFAYLPFTQLRRGNIMVDTFTNRLSLSTRAKIDGVWDLAYAAFIAFMSIALINGTLEALKSGETTMQRQILIWPSIGLSAALCLLLFVSAAITGLRLVSRKS